VQSGGRCQDGEWRAVDSGIAVNPGTGFVLSSILRNRITLKDVEVQQRDFDSCQPTPPINLLTAQTPPFAEAWLRSTPHNRAQVESGGPGRAAGRWG
jgi:hypothetical protein